MAIHLKPNVSSDRVMAHLLTAAPIPSARSKRKTPDFPILDFQCVWACHQSSDQILDNRFVHSRAVTFGLAGAVLGLNTGGQMAKAARRPPPPPPTEKKDPSVSGVQAKVLASKKREEAMKEEVGKLREKGISINEPSE